MIDGCFDICETHDVRQLPDAEGSASDDEFERLERTIDEMDSHSFVEVSAKRNVIGSARRPDVISIGSQGSWEDIDDDDDDEVFPSTNQKQSLKKSEKFVTTATTSTSKNAKSSGSPAKSRFVVSRQMNTTVRVRNSTSRSVTSQQRGKWGTLRTITERSFSVDESPSPTSAPAFLKPKKPRQEFSDDVTWEDVGFEPGSSMMEDLGVLDTGKATGIIE